MYVEDLLALNFMMNTSLLYLAARMTGRQAGRRIFAGGLLAACYSLAVFLPSSFLAFSWFGKILASLLIIWFTFRPTRWLEALRLCGAFFLASFLAGGAVFALYFFGSTTTVMLGGIFYIEPPRPGMLFIGVLLVFLLVMGVWQFGERQRRRQDFRFQIHVSNREKTVTAAAFVDTGNQLKNPLTGKPLCVASYKALWDLLPECLQKAYQDGGDPVSALASVPQGEAERFGVVPFRSLENAGVLVTYRAVRVVIEGNNYREERDDMLFALTSKALSLDNDAEVLLHPFILEYTGGVGC